MKYIPWLSHWFPSKKGLIFCRVLMIKDQKFCLCSPRSRFILWVFTYSVATERSMWFEGRLLLHKYSYIRHRIFDAGLYQWNIFFVLEYYWSPSFEEHHFLQRLLLFSLDRVYHKAKDCLHFSVLWVFSWNFSCLIDPENFFGVVYFFHWSDIQSK